MNNKEKIILSKLLKIASNQQKILERLTQEQDPNIVYLKSAAQITAANNGFNASQVDVTADIQVMGGYTVKVAGAPKDNVTREKFIRQLKTMVSTQKPDQPELSNIFVVFTD